MSSQTKLTVDDVARMLATGVLREDDRVELIDGELVSMSPIGPKHIGIVKRLSRLLHERLGRKVSISTQDAIRLSEFSEPQPDVAVMRPRADDYDQSLPTPADILLLVEVADSSLEFDRDEKIPRYAEEGIPEVWLIDARGETISQHTGPAGDHYTDIRELSIGHEVVCCSISGFSVTVAEVLRSQAASS